MPFTQSFLHPLSVLPFSPENLFQSLVNSHASAPEVGGLRPVKYLGDYLSQLNAGTIVVEEPYTDADFLDDYTAYYARCFSSYGRWCRRLHFFSRSFDGEEFKGLVDHQSSLQSDYLGFVVARPLPQAIIGRSVLRTFAPEGRRFFPVAKKYRVNLFGLDLYVEGLAFQEQDTVLAACATVALWSAFQKTGDLFGSPIPTPAVITRAATQAEHFGRPIPQHGLRIEELCNAIRHNGLEPEVVDLERTSKVPLASLLYGYLHMGLPAILCVEIPKVGHHAITLTGCSIQQQIQRPRREWIVPMTGARIDKFYGHDDQVGPNARLTVRASPSGFSERHPIRFESSWVDGNGEPFLYPVAVVLPVYNKIRLTFLDLQSWIAPLHTVLAGVFPDSHGIEWDVHLTLSNDYKKELRSDRGLVDSARSNLLFSPHPRFWWRATMTYRGLPCFDLLFDATGIARSFPLSAIVWRVDAVAELVKHLVKTEPAATAVSKMLKSERYVGFLRKSIEVRDRPADLMLDLHGR